MQKTIFTLTLFLLPLLGFSQVVPNNGCVFNDSTGNNGDTCTFTICVYRTINCGFDCSGCIQSANPECITVHPGDTACFSTVPHFENCGPDLYEITFWCTGETGTFWSNPGNAIPINNSGGLTIGTAHDYGNGAIIITRP